MGHFPPPPIAVRDGSGLPDPLLGLGASRRGRTGAAFCSFMAAVRIATGGAILLRTSPATFASRRLICPAWAIVGGERTTPPGFAPKKSVP